MSNLAQTIAIIVSVVAIFGAQTAWMLRAFAQVDQRLDGIDGRLDRVDGRFDRMDGRFDRMDGRLDDLKTEIVRDHGERIAKLEERIIRHS